MLERLTSLVDSDTNSKTFGCMRWFAEESTVSDTNAAFFALFPLATLAICRPDLVPANHLQEIQSLLEQTTPWFKAECNEPKLYYPNKSLSDGAMLLATGTLLESDSLTTQALAFLRRWSDYTSERGWGWGENISLGYQRVILIALRLAQNLASSHDTSLAKQLGDYKHDILEEALFHDGAEFVPSIRSYNFSGGVRVNSLSYALVGHPESAITDLVSYSGQEWAKSIMLLLFARELEQTTYHPQMVPRTRTRRVFDDSYATTWIGEGIRLGTVSRFPVMPDHYQQTGWGLGWQSFPVSALVDERGVSTLLWYARREEEETTHPYCGDDGLHRNYVLAGRRPYPAVATHAVQDERVAVVVRTVSRIHDDAIDFADQWLFRGSAGLVKQSDEWFVQQSGHTCLAVKPLLRYGSDSSALETPEPELVSQGDDEAVRVVLHQAQDGPLAADRLEAAWVIVAHDSAESLETVLAELDQIKIDDRALYPTSVPRMDYAYVRAIDISGFGSKGNQSLSLNVDYHYDLWR